MDAFLSDEEGLVFSRTCGSASWLLPTGHLDSLELRTSYKRVEGLIKVDVIRCEVSLSSACICMHMWPLGCHN